METAVEQGAIKDRVVTRSIRIDDEDYSFPDKYTDENGIELSFIPYGGGIYRAVSKSHRDTGYTVFAEKVDGKWEYTIEDGVPAPIISEA